MPLPTPPADQSGLPIPLPPPEFFQSKDWLYDTIMGQIEPDLTTTQIDHLEEKYKGETENQKKERHAAYEEAFVLFEKIFKQVTEKVEADVREQHLKAQKQRDREEQKEKTKEMSQVEKELDSDAASV